MIVKPKYNYGYKVGVTVHINGKKFPTKKGYVYAHNKNNKAVQSALIEGQYYNDDELVVTALKKKSVTMPKLRHNKKYNNNKQLTKGTQ